MCACAPKRLSPRRVAAEVSDLCRMLKSGSRLASRSRRDLCGSFGSHKCHSSLDRMQPSNQERRTLLRRGRILGERTKELITIVSCSTFGRWVRELE